MLVIIMHHCRCQSRWFEPEIGNQSIGVVRGWFLELVNFLEKDFHIVEY